MVICKFLTKWLIPLERPWHFECLKWVIFELVGFRVDFSKYRHKLAIHDFFVCIISNFNLLNNFYLKRYASKRRQGPFLSFWIHALKNEKYAINLFKYMIYKSPEWQICLKYGSIQDWCVRFRKWVIFEQKESKAQKLKFCSNTTPVD